MQRTLSTVERDALQSVLDVVERETDSEHTKGMSRFTFFLGLANLILSAFLLGACTESFWLVYAIQALFIIGLRIRHSWSISKNTPTQPGMMLYYLDLCWIANFLLAFSFMAVLVEVLEERYLGTRTVGALNARAVARAPTAGLIAHLIATGPLLWSVFILPCKMVLRPRLLRGEVADATAAGPARHRQLREHLDSLVARLHRCGNQPVS